MSHPCGSCGKYSFPRPTTCFWCQDTRTEEEKAAAIQAGIEVVKDPMRKPPPKSAFEEARLKLHKYRRHEKKGGRQ